MTLTDLVRILRLRWRIVVAFLTTGLLCGVAYFLSAPAMYTANTTLYVAATAVDSPLNAYQGAQLSQQRVSSYVSLATSTRVARQVVQDLALPEDPDTLSTRLAATAPTQSVVITYSATDADPSRAVQIVNDAANVFTGVVNEIERPLSSASVQAVSVRVVEPSTAAARTSTGLRNAVGFGLLAGLVLGLLAALVRHSADTRIRDADVLQEESKFPLLASIPTARSERADSVMIEDPSSREAEAYRRFRTNLQFIGVETAPRVLLLTSPAPSDGKTTCTLNLAVALSASGASVLVVDADLRRPSIASRLGLETNVGLSTYLTGRLTFEAAVQRHNLGRFDVVASGIVPPNPSELLSSSAMKHFTATAKSQYDYVLIDTPPLLPVVDTAAAADACDGAILICRAKKTTRKQLANSVEALDAVDAVCFGHVLNMVAENSSRRDMYDSYYIAAPSEAYAPNQQENSAQNLNSRRHRNTTSRHS